MIANPEDLEENPYFQNEINQARKEEAGRKGYVPLCQRLFNWRMSTEGGPFDVSEDKLSELDEMIFPIIAEYLEDGKFECDESCPGYTPLPVEPFYLENSEFVMCKRHLSKEFLNMVGGWEKLKSYVENPEW